MSRKVGAMLIGMNGALGTTLLCAQAAERISPEVDFSTPTGSDPDLAGLDLIEHSNIYYGGWDVVSQAPSEAAKTHGVVPEPTLARVGEYIDRTPRYPAVLIETGSAVDDIISQTESSSRGKDPSFATSIFTQRPLREMIQSLHFHYL